MMQAAQPRSGYDVAICTGILQGFTTSRSSLCQSEMRPVFMVVTDIFVHQAFQMTSIEYDYMVKQVSTTASDPALGNSVLPRTPEAGSFRLDAQCLDGTDDVLIEVRGPVENQVAWRRVIGECFAQLLCNPPAARMAGDTPVQDSPPIMRNDEEAVPRQNAIWTQIRVTLGIRGKVAWVSIPKEVFRNSRMLQEVCRM